MDKPSWSAYRIDARFHDEFQGSAFYADLASQYILITTGIITFAMAYIRPWITSLGKEKEGGFRYKFFQFGTIMMTFTMIFDGTGLTLKRQKMRFVYYTFGAVLSGTYMAADMLITLVVLMQINFRSPTQHYSSMNLLLFVTLGILGCVRWGIACKFFATLGDGQPYLPDLEVGYKVIFVALALLPVKAGMNRARLRTEKDLFPTLTSLLALFLLAQKVHALAITVKLFETIHAKRRRDRVVPVTFSFAADATTNLLWVVILFLLATMSMRTNQILKKRGPASSATTPDDIPSSNTGAAESNPEELPPPYEFLREIAIIKEKGLGELLLPRNWSESEGESTSEVPVEPVIPEKGDSASVAIVRHD